MDDEDNRFDFDAPGHFDFRAGDTAASGAPTDDGFFGKYLFVCAPIVKHVDTMYAYNLSTARCGSSLQSRFERLIHQV